MREIVAVVCFSLLTLVTPVAAVAQAVYGNIVGTVLDQSGAGLPDAKVTITDTNRAVSFTTYQRITKRTSPVMVNTSTVKKSAAASPSQ